MRVVLVMDIRHLFEPFDVMMIDWVRHTQLSMHVLLNKADKLRHGASTSALRTAKQRLASPQFSLQLFSALTGAGRDEAIDKLGTWLTLQVG